MLEKINKNMQANNQRLSNIEQVIRMVLPGKQNAFTYGYPNNCLTPSVLEICEYTMRHMNETRSKATNYLKANGIV